MAYHIRYYYNRGLYHVALIVVAGTAFNWAMITLTGVNLVKRVFEGVTIPENVLAIIVCAAAVIVIWRNWVD